jgi:acyl-coenzyme A thioesterase PaaI-like protein
MGKILSSPRALRRALAWWPPYRGAGIKVLHIADDWSSARVRLRLGRLNRNYFGTHFGGSLYSMSDPFFALLAVNRLGRDYIVWDKAGEIEYVSPGRGDVFADFRLPEDRLEEIRKATADGEKALPWFETAITTGEGMVVARVRKQLYVPLKRRAYGLSAGRT